MAPPLVALARALPYGHDWDGSWKYNMPIEGFVEESWSQGFMVGALVVMAFITIANMSRRLLHKLILVELCLAMLHGTFCFMEFPGYGWYVSSTATLLYSSWYLHNIIAWMKTKPFLSRRNSLIYIISFLCVTPYWGLETYANFAFNNNIDPIFIKTRPFELLFRDPWWFFTCLNLVYNIKKRYGFALSRLIRICPRFGVMLTAMVISIIFSIVDVLCTVIGFGEVPGVNPYWKLSLVFKCLCDIVILDDFQSALDKLRINFIGDLESNRTGCQPRRRRVSYDARSLPGHALPQPSMSLSTVPRALSGSKSESQQPPAAARFSASVFGRDRSTIKDEELDNIYVTKTVTVDTLEAEGYVTPDDELDPPSAEGSVHYKPEAW